MAAGSNILPFPIHGAAMRAALPWLDGDGDLVPGVAGADTEISKDAGTFADCTNEVIEIATSSGMHYLDLTGTEMTADMVCLISKGTGVKTTPLVFYPRRLPSIRTGTAQAGAEGTITLDASASAKDDFYNGCYVQATNNDPAGIQGQTRLITDYVGSTKVATIAPNWATNPTSATTFSVLVPENAIVNGWAGAAVVDPTTAGTPDVGVAASVTGAVGSVTGHTAQTGDNYARLGAPAGASVSADVAAVKGETVSILEDTETTLPATLATIAGYLDTEIAAILEDTGTTLPALIAALHNLSAAQVNAEVDTALGDYDGPTKAEMDTAHALLATVAALATVDTVVDALKVIADNLPNSGALTDIIDRQEADHVLNKPGGGAAWQEVMHKKSTPATIYATKNLTQQDDTAVTDENHIVANMDEA